MNTDTPGTNNQIQWSDNVGWSVPADFARRLERERDTLAAWKEGRLKVNEWWAEVDRIVREHPDTIIGRTVADEAVRLIQERDKFLSLLKHAEPFMRHGLNCPARIGEGHACECGMLDVWKEVRHV
jgi:hypothetical protein